MRSPFFNHTVSACAALASRHNKAETGNLAAFNQTYAKRLVSGRSVVLILSDGFDTDPPALIGAELARLKRRGCRIVWLNPLKGWRGYQPVAAGMAAALPHLDLFAAANTLATLAELEPELARL